MTGYKLDLKEAAKENDFYRCVIYTGPHAQLVLMSLAPGEEIGAETHDVDQFIYVVDGEGTCSLAGEDYDFEKGEAIFVPAGVQHNVVNTDDEEMKLFTLYSPPQHPAGTVQETKPEEAMASA